MKDIVVSAISTVGSTQREVCEHMGWVPQSMTDRLGKETLKLSDFLEIMDFLGIDVDFRVRDTGALIGKKGNGLGRRIRKTVNRVTYDTSTDVAVSNNFYSESKNSKYDAHGKAVELYTGKDGYYFAVYTEGDEEGKEDRLVPVPDSVAAAFIEKYGTSMYDKY